MNAESVIKTVSGATGLTEADCARLTGVASGLVVAMVSVHPRPEGNPTGGGGTGTGGTVPAPAPAAAAAPAPAAAAAMIGTTGAASALTPENLVGVIARTANVDPQHAAHALRAVAAAIRDIASAALAAAAK